MWQKFQPSGKKQHNPTNTTFDVEGQLFFASVEGFVESFDFSVKGKNITIDFSEAHIWDDSAVGAIDKVVLKYRENHNTVTITGLDSASKRLVEKLAIYNQPNPNVSGH